MARGDGVRAVENFWARVWQAPPDLDAVDELVVEDFVIISGGAEIRSRRAFKEWVNAFQAAIGDLQFEVLESFESADGTRVASTWRMTGTNNGVLGTEPTGEPLEMSGIAVWSVREDGMLLSNRVERNALEVYRALTGP
jgi:ketosteroid isomerase-like protein